MKIILLSITVDDQTKAERFYADKLGFVKAKDFPVGEHRWITFTAPDGHADVELTLEPLGLEAARTYQKALYGQGIPCAMFGVADLDAEFAALSAKGVVFKGPVQRHPDMPAIAVFDDTCGNWIMLVETGG